MKKYKQLSYEERIQIHTLQQNGESIRDIAKQLGRSPNTISRELKEKKVKNVYIPKKAQHKTYVRRHLAKRDCMKVALDSWLTQTVEEKLKLGWSPERIAGWCTKEGHSIATRSVYRYIHSRALDHHLFSRKYKKKTGPKRYSAPVHRDERRFVEHRPETTTSGHFEADFVVSSHNTSCLLVVVDRYTRYTDIRHIPNRKHVTVSQAFESIFANKKVKTLTLDNDISFSHWKLLEKLLHTKIYFTHPYCSWEKGLVENTNRWIRLFVPKKSDIKQTSAKQLQDALYYLNDIPRQCLGYKTAREVLLERK